MHKRGVIADHVLAALHAGRDIGRRTLDRLAGLTGMSADDIESMLARDPIIAAVRRRFEDERERDAVQRQAARDAETLADLFESEAAE